jgi:hypothetical protein
MSNADNVMTAGADVPRREILRMPGLSAQVFIALGLGLVAGIFFGELMTVLEPLGDIFIGLLQMAVWPYIMVALIGGLGRLTSKQAASLGLRAKGTYHRFCNRFIGRRLAAYRGGHQASIGRDRGTHSRRR